MYAHIGEEIIVYSRKSDDQLKILRCLLEGIRTISNLMTQKPEETFETSAKSVFRQFLDRPWAISCIQSQPIVEIFCFLAGR